MGMFFTKLFDRLSAKTESRILMVRQIFVCVAVGLGCSSLA